MTEFLTSTRKFYMHPAHRTVGVLRTSSPSAPSRSEDFWKAEPETEQKHLLFVADTQDYLAQEALTLFERILLGYGNVRCHRVAYASKAVERFSGANCIVTFNRGFHVVRDWAAMKADVLLDQLAMFAYQSEMELDVLPAGRHPVLDKINAFSSVCEMGETPELLSGCDSLLEGRASGLVFPLAWAKQGGGRLFSTRLGRPTDFQNRTFIRLAMNAIAWVSEH